MTSTAVTRITHSCHLIEIGGAPSSSTPGSASGPVTTLVTRPPWALPTCPVWTRC